MKGKKHCNNCGKIKKIEGYESNYDNDTDTDDDDDDEEHMPIFNNNKILLILVFILSIFCIVQYLNQQETNNEMREMVRGLYHIMHGQAGNQLTSQVGNQSTSQVGNQVNTTSITGTTNVA